MAIASQEKIPPNYSYLNGYTFNRNLHGYLRSEHCGENFQDNILQPIINTLPKEKEHLLGIDLACGLGEGASAMEKLSNGRIACVRFDLNRIALTHSPGNRIQGLLQEIPLKSNTFDIALFKDALIHVFDKKKLFRELYRIMAPGGTLMLVSQTRLRIDASVSSFYPPGHPRYNKEKPDEPMYHKVSSEDDYIRVKKILAREGHILISPPYTQVSPDHAWYFSLQAGFTLTKQFSWFPPEKDWHDDTADRFVFYLTKQK